MPAISPPVPESSGPACTTAGVLRLVAGSRSSSGVQCPLCGSARVRRHGCFADKSGTRRQRFLCRRCGKTSSQLTGTPLARVRRLELCPDMAACLVRGLSLRQTAARLGLHFTTAFRWRHRILGAAAGAPAPVLAGIIEAMVMVLPFSEKGQYPTTPGLGRPWRSACDYRPRAGVLLAVDREQRALSTYLGQGGFQMPVPAVPYQFPRARLAPGSVLCAANGGAFLERECGKLGVSTATCADGAPYTILNVVGMKERLRVWLKRFRGVATRHLDKYLTLHRYADRLGELAEVAIARELLAAACALPATGQAG